MTRAGPHGGEVVMRRFALVLAALLLGPFAGWLSARVMLDRSALTMGANVGGWREVTNAPDTFAATYSSGYFMTRGQLPPPQHVRLFMRLRDDAGNTLRSDCATQIEGLPPQGRWWQIGADSRSGTRSIGSGSIVREADGAYIVTLWNMVSPGNWLALGEAEDYSLRLYVHDQATEDDGNLPLPRVKRLGC
jgi:hypothetical protein